MLSEKIRQQHRYLTIEPGLFSPLIPGCLLWICLRLMVRMVSMPLRVAFADGNDRGTVALIGGLSQFSPFEVTHAA